MNYVQRENAFPTNVGGPRIEEPKEEKLMKVVRPLAIRQSLAKRKTRLE